MKHWPNSKITDSSAQQRSCYLLITHRSYSDPLEENLCKRPPPPRKLPPFGPPPPLGISVALLSGAGGGEMDIFCKFSQLCASYIFVP